MVGFANTDAELTVLASEEVVFNAKPGQFVYNCDSVKVSERTEYGYDLYGLFISTDVDENDELYIMPVSEVGALADNTVGFIINNVDAELKIDSDWQPFGAELLANLNSIGVVYNYDVATLDSGLDYRKTKPKEYPYYHDDSICPSGWYLPSSQEYEELNSASGSLKKFFGNNISLYKQLELRADSVYPLLLGKKIIVEAPYPSYDFSFTMDSNVGYYWTSDEKAVLFLNGAYYNSSDIYGAFDYFYGNGYASVRCKATSNYK